MPYICLITPMRLTFHIFKTSLLFFGLTLCLLSTQGQSFSSTRFQLKNAQSIEQLKAAYFPENIDLSLQFDTKSLVGTHQYYQLSYQGVELYHATLKVQNANDGRQFLTVPIFPKNAVFPSHTKDVKGALLRVQDIIPVGNQVKIKPIYFIENELLKAGYSIKHEGQNNLNEWILDSDLNILNYSDLTSHDKPDSLIAVNIFKPDPITSAETEYGGVFQDYNDSNVVELNEQLKMDSIWVRWDDTANVWRLISDYAYALDFSNPTGEAPTSFNGDFMFERGDDGFEFVNAFYHINTQAEYLKKLGFDSLMNYAIKFDARGAEIDQSSFVPSIVGDPRLIFGIGGVDDAEDADVVVHEYGHAISAAATYETNIGSERKALDEGFCDYLAYSYSKSILDYNSDEIFDWDGHNEFWSGRTIPLFRTYPSDLQNNIYGDGLIWTSALSEISNLIGKGKTDQLAIQTLFGFYENMLLIDAGALLLQNDTLLNNAEHADIIYIVLCNKGLYPGCEDTNSTTLPLRNPYLGKTEAFFNGGNDLKIYPNKTIINSYSVYDINGQLLETQTISSEGLAFLDIELNLPPRGFYLLTLYTNEGPFTFKLIRPIR